MYDFDADATMIHLGPEDPCPYCEVRAAGHAPIEGETACGGRVPSEAPGDGFWGRRWAHPEEEEEGPVRDHEEEGAAFWGRMLRSRR